MLTPAIVMQIQAILGSDIAMVLDECPPWPCEYDYAAKSNELTINWARRCKQWMEENAPGAIDVVSAGVGAGSLVSSVAETAAVTTRQLVFGIVQGATFEQLRKQCAEALVQMNFDGYAVGGVSVGEPEEEMFRAVESSEPLLPPDKPRYAMGLGTPPQLLEMIARGMDMFDCVLPTRLARNGTAFSPTGTLNLKNAEFTKDKRPIDPDCSCTACSEFTRGYIRHLIKAEEILGLRLITLHNLHFYLELMRQARAKIDNGTFNEFRRDFAANYEPHESDLAI
jgi:queuine tRNA-ribosyltransferase